MTTIARATRNTIGDAFRRAAARFGSREALTFGPRRWTFAELDRAATRVACRLRASGLEPGDRVAAYGRNSDAYVLLWLGILRARCIHVPINYALAGGELDYILRQSGARAAFRDAALARELDVVPARRDLALVGSFAEAGGPCDVIETALGAGSDEAPDDGARDDDVAQILYTSGTTAAPKGAMLTHRALLAEYTSCIHDLDYRADDIALGALPLYHSAQMHVFTMPQMLAGAPTRLIEAPDPATVLELVERLGITSFFAPPTVWIGLLRHPDFARRNLGTLEKLYYGASIMPTPVLAELAERLPRARLFNCYGQSEIAPMATVLRPEEHAERPASAGRPVFNVETRVVDPQMRDVAPGAHGEIVHRSPHLLVGYWDKPAETEEAFAGGWFHSGDVGYFDDAGYLYIVDRMKDVINTGGVLVASREVEEALYEHPAVSEVAVIALPDPKWIEAVTAIVVLRNGSAADEAALVAHVRERLAPFKVPKRVFFVETLPRNTAGKLLKRELRERFATADAAARDVAPTV